MANSETSLRAVLTDVDADFVLVGAVAVVTLLVDIVGRWALVGVVGVGVQPLALLVVLTAVTVGATARWGLVVGLLGSGLLLGDWTGGVIRASAALAAAVVWLRVWGSTPDRETWLRWLLRYVVAAVLATLTLAATTAWLSDLFAVSAFSVVAAPSLMGNLPLALLGAPLAWALGDVGAERGWRTDDDPLSTRGTALALGVLAVWVGGGTVGSFLYRAAGTIEAERFGREIGPTAELLVVLGGPQGRYAVLALSVVAVIALALVFRYE